MFVYIYIIFEAGSHVVLADLELLLSLFLQCWDYMSAPRGPFFLQSKALVIGGGSLREGSKDDGFQSRTLGT